jgi:MYXO-CTERM domain-containing protein
VLTVNGAFVESVAGNSITINESLLAPAPEPSRALLALAGLGGVALRRRRKLVA